MVPTSSVCRVAALAGLLVVATAGGVRADDATTPAPRIRPIDAAGVLDAVRSSGARVALVNVWATWCEPCREEMPDLLRLRRELASTGFRLILVSGDFVDQHDEAVRFLGGLGVDFDSFIKNEDDMAFIDGLGSSWSGALPASFLYDAGGTLIDFWEGKRDYDALRSRLLRALETDEEENRP